MIPIYLGFDPREEVGSHVFTSSLINRASRPVSFCPLHLPLFSSFYGTKQGTNSFTFTRFLIPFLQEWKGWAIFADGADMICRANISELWALRDPYKAVQVVKHDYQTQHPRKYIGTRMECENQHYPRKNWASMMLINCGHFWWRDMTPEHVENLKPLDLLQFSWLKDELIGELPKEWNWLADEYGENPDAKILHWTAGIPGFPHYKDAPHAWYWREAHKRMNHATE